MFKYHYVGFFNHNPLLFATFYSGSFRNFLTRVLKRCVVDIGIRSGWMQILSPHWFCCERWMFKFLKFFLLCRSHMHAQFSKTFFRVLSKLWSYSMHQTFFINSARKKRQNFITHNNKLVGIMQPHFIKRELPFIKRANI